MSRRHNAYLKLLVVAAIWGSAGPIVKFTLEGISPFSFLAYRFGISALFSLLYITIKGIKIPKIKKNLPAIALYGILSFSIALSLLFFGFDNSTVLDVTLLGLAGPLIVTAGGVLFFHDRITKREKMGIGIAVTGALINSILPLLSDSANLRVTGNILILGFLITDSAGVLYSKYLTQKKIPGISITLVGFIFAAITIIPIAFITEGTSEVITSVISLPFKYHLGVWYMALMSGILAYFLAIQAERSIEVSEAWLFMYLQPIFAIPLAVIWLGESLTGTFLIGGSIIAFGVYLAESKPKKKMRSTN